MTVVVDRVEVGDWNVPYEKWELNEHRMIIPADEHRPAASLVEFRFSGFRKPDGDTDARPLAVLFDRIQARPLSH